MPASRDLSYQVGVDADDAVSGLKRLESAVKSTLAEVEGEFDESASATDKFTASIDQVAAKLRTEFGQAEAAATELKRALRDIDSGLDVGDALASLRQMGATFDDITADADRFAASLKQLDDVRLDGVKQLDNVAPGLATKLDDVGRSANSSKSVLANMVGNSSQDLGELGGIAGTAGVAIGQMGEYMVDAAAGGEKLKSVIGSFATLAVPIAAVLVGVQGFQDKLKRAAAVKAFRKEEVEGYADALDDADSTLGAIVDKLKAAEGLEVNIFGKDVDVVEQFNKLGLSADDAAKLIAGGRPAIDAWADAMRAAGADGDDLALVTLTLSRNVEDLAKAQENKAASDEFFGKGTERVTQAMDDQIGKIGEWITATAEMTAETAAAIERQNELKQGIAEVVSGEDQRRVEAFTAAIAELSDLDLAMPAINVNQLLQDTDQMEAIGKGWGTALGSAASNASIAALADLSGAINAQLLSAFEQGGVQGMVDSAAIMRTALVEQFGPEVGNQIIDSLGIADEQIVVGAKVAMDKSELEETMALLALLDQDTAAAKQITVNFLAGGYVNDPQAFRNDVVGALEDEGVEVPVTLASVDTIPDMPPVELATELDTSGAEADAQAFAGKGRVAKVELDADDTKAESKAEGFRTKRREIVPALLTVDTAPAEAKLDRFTEITRTSLVTADVATAAAERELDQLTRPRTVDITIRTIEDSTDRWYRLNAGG